MGYSGDGAHVSWYILIILSTSADAGEGPPSTSPSLAPNTKKAKEARAEYYGNDRAAQQVQQVPQNLQ